MHHGKKCDQAQEKENESLDRRGLLGDPSLHAGLEALLNSVPKQEDGVRRTHSDLHETAKHPHPPLPLLQHAEYGVSGPRSALRDQGGAPS